GVDTKIQLCPVIEIDEQFRVEHVPFKSGYGGEADLRRIIGPVSVMRGKYGRSDLPEFFPVKAVDVQAPSRCSVYVKTQFPFFGWCLGNQVYQTRYRAATIQRGC